MRGKFAVGAVVICLAFVVTLPFAFSADGTLETTVTTDIVAMTVPSSLDYGHVGASASKNIGPLSIQNSGNVRADFSILGGDAETYDAYGDVIASWDITAAATGTDTYNHQFSCSVNSGYLDEAPAAYVTMANDVNSGSSVGLTLTITMPSSSTVPGVYTAPVYIRATAG